MNKLLTVTEVAKLIKMSKSSVYKHVEQNKLPHVKIGVNLRFLESQIKNHILNNIVSSITPKERN